MDTAFVNMAVAVMVAALALVALGALVYLGIPNLLLRRPVPWVDAKLRHTLKGSAGHLPQGTLLTFDDGPNPYSTPRVLNVLKKHQIKAIFFVVAARAQEQPELIKQILAQGHEIGLHALEHHPLISPFQSYRELEQGYLILRSLGCKPRYFRPPHGVYTLSTLYFCRKFNLKPLHWDALVGDWLYVPNETLVKRLERAAGPGKIVVLHDGYAGAADPRSHKRIAEVLSAFIDRELAEGRSLSNAAAGSH